MTTITVNIENREDLSLLKEMLSRFGLKFKVDEHTSQEVIYANLKKSLTEIQKWKQGKIELQNAKSAIEEIESELNA